MKLSDINKENNFKVPNGYFDNFYDKLQEKIKNEEKPTKKVLHLNFLLKVAAILLLGLLMFSPVNNFNKYNINTISENNQNNDFKLSDEELLDYYASTLSDYELFELLSESN